MTKESKPGDKVTLNTVQGETHGTIEKKVTSEAHVKGHVAKPTKNAPERPSEIRQTGQGSDAQTRAA